ncbi:MAG: class I SAM-dependent methyltransferase [Thermaerobacterales bacterium]
MGTHIPDNRKNRLEWIYSAQDNSDLERRYDKWAQDYESDVIAYGYKIPAAAAGFVCRHTAAGDGSILDAGAGTGIMGETLSLLGYRDVVAVDMSRGMLALADAKGVYRGLHRMVLGERLQFDDRQFSAVVAVGVLSVGHAPPESFDELIRVTRSGGR